MARGIVIGAVVAFASASTAVAVAAPLGLVSAFVGSGHAAIDACDTAFTHGYTTSRGNVTTVTVGGIADPGCEGATVRATVKNAAGASIAAAGPLPVPSDGDTLDDTVSLSTSPQPPAGQVAGVDIVLEGP